jgi:chromosome segregation ATPase
MSETSPQSSSLFADPGRLRRELEEKSLLVQSIRKELILSQITVLELHDTILQKETDKADAVSILGQVEHVLEEKINYIFELDRVLNEKIAALRAELAAQKTAHDRVTQDLVQKLDAANREIGATHTMAAGYARDLAQTREQLQHAVQDLATVRAQLAGTQATLAQTRRDLSDTQAAQRATEDARAALAREIAAMRASVSWKLTTPLRALRRLLS